MESAEPPTADAAPYKRLAEAVLIQAIKDATHDRRHKKRKLSVSAQRDKRLLSKDLSQATYFLLKDNENFGFWCELAHLHPRAVRNQLHRKLGLRSTWALIRTLSGRRKEEEKRNDCLSM